MKRSSNVLLALGFIGALLALFIGAWVVSLLISPGEGTTTNNEDPSIFGSLFPFNLIGGSTDNPSDLNGDTTPQGPVPAVRQITNRQVAGATFANSNGTAVVRFVERETGHIYEVPLAANTATRLTNTTVPAVHDALWVSASSTILRFLRDTNEIENFYGFFSSTTPDQTLQGAFIKPYKRLATGAGGAIIAGVLETSSATLELAAADGSGPKTVIVSPVRSWVPLLSGNRVLLVSAPASGVPGSIYDTINSRLTKVSPSVQGLEALSNANGTYILISGGGRRAQSLALLDTAEGVTASLPRGTTVSKCVWVGRTDTALCAMPKELPLGNYPDDWLLGRVHTEDDFWFINAATGVMTVAVELTVATEKAIDVSKVVVNETGTHAAFIDRNDGTLWLASLGQ